MPVTHSKVSAKADGADAALVRPSDWNAAHAGSPDALVYPTLDRFQANALSVTGAQTFTAGVYYDAGTLYAADHRILLIGVCVRLNDQGHHTYIGGAILGLTYWKAAGTQIPVTFPLAAHAWNDVTCSIRQKLGDNSWVNIQFSFSADITIDANGCVKIAYQPLLRMNDYL